jgi:hypothetical protein
MIRAFTYPRYHGKEAPGSTKLRVKQLQKYWPEYKEYKYGEKPDVMVYQKVYIQDDWRLMENALWKQILDICDPDWLEGASIRETVDYMDGITCPTEAMAGFLRQLTDRPIKVIPDRHDLELFPKPKVHKGKLKSAVWFGYRQNAELLKDTFNTLDRMGIKLTVISNDNPYFQKTDGTYVEYIRFDDETIRQNLQQFDVCILPQGTRPQDRFKSNNKTTMAQLCGVPVVSNSEDLDAMQTAEARNAYVEKWYNKTRELYDCKLSVQEMKDFIRGL